MDSESLYKLIEEIASERIENWEVNEYSNNSLELQWESDSLERDVILNIHTDTVDVQFAVFFDDHEKNERLWESKDVASVNLEYSSVISESIRSAITDAESVNKSELEFIDKI